MKHLLALSLTCVAMAAQLEAEAAVWRINNNSIYTQNCTHCFTSIVDALASGSGVNYFDTLHIEPSGTPYQLAVINKPLVLIGPGSNLGQGAGSNDGLQANSQAASIWGLTIQGFAGTGSGTVVEGLEFIGQVTINCSNVLVIRNRFQGAGRVGIWSSDGSWSNIQIAENYFMGGYYSLGYDHGIVATGVLGLSNLMIHNNYFENTIDLTSLYTGCVVANNTFDYPAPSYFFDAVVKNNLFVDPLATLPLATNLLHNYAEGLNTLPSGSGNENAIDMSQVFVGIGSDDSRWELLPGDWMIAADDGGQLGMFGGSTPYVLSGIPNIPTIYELTAPATAIQGEQINVTLSTKSNN